MGSKGFSSSVTCSASQGRENACGANGAYDGDSVGEGFVDQVEDEETGDSCDAVGGGLARERSRSASLGDMLQNGPSPRRVGLQAHRPSALRTYV